MKFRPTPAVNNLSTHQFRQQRQGSTKSAQRLLEIAFAMWEGRRRAG